MLNFKDIYREARSREAPVNPCENGILQGIKEIKDWYLKEEVSFEDALEMLEEKGLTNKKARDLVGEWNLWLSSEKSKKFDQQISHKYNK
jgi:hypothetical protein